jgi:uncharacterized UBP type Zn finger protein
VPSNDESDFYAYLPMSAGLQNQGATCYLNSLLQSLYMTPELRSALYTWEYDPARMEPRTQCVPYQLQRLFVMLQKNAAEKDSGKRPASTTNDLTRSFGWESADSFEQQVGPAATASKPTSPILQCQLSPPPLPAT